MTLREVIGTIQEPISLSEAKEHLRVTGTEEDSYILSLITSSRVYVEKELAETLHGATYDYWMDDFPSGDIELPQPPLLTVTYVKYYDADNTLQTLVANTDYRVDANRLPGIVEVINSWPGTYDRTSAVNIRFTAGYADNSEIDANKIDLMKLYLASRYDDREGELIKPGLVSMINKVRKVRF